jgi:pimeloyl-ACP methyl ester carboxylesterase
VLPRVKTPLLLIHGERDALIPPSHSDRLAAQAPQARVLKVPGAGHNDLQQFPAYLDGLRAALDAL